MICDYTSIKKNIKQPLQPPLIPGTIAEKSYRMFSKHN